MVIHDKKGYKHRLKKTKQIVIPYKLAQINKDQLKKITDYFKKICYYFCIIIDNSMNPQNCVEVYWRDDSQIWYNENCLIMTIVLNPDAKLIDFYKFLSEIGEDFGIPDNAILIRDMQETSLLITKPPSD